jgi:hypothetical protein
MTADPDRFFHATLLGGFLHVRDIPDWGPWRVESIEYTQESFVDAILRPGTRDRKVRTPEELQATLAEPRGPAPSRTLWMHESLLDEARRLWEQMATHLGYQATDRRHDPADSP